MSNEEKLIIITTNEDFIRQVSSSMNEKTHLIDLDEDLLNGRNSFALSLISQLSSLNSTTNEFHRQILQTEENHSENLRKSIEKKESDLKCVICGDKSIGYNYDVLSCASCKAFFRRNAHKKLNKDRCLNGLGKCSIQYLNHRKCQFCRLEKCVEMGMRKDFLLSDIEKEKRRERFQLKSKMKSFEEENHLSTELCLTKFNFRNDQNNSRSFDENSSDDIDQFLIEMNNEIEFNDRIVDDENVNSKEVLFENYFINENQIHLENLNQIFSSIFIKRDFISSLPNINDKQSAIISWSQSINYISMLMIQFFRQDYYFEQLNDNDRFLLIKRNLFSIFPLIKCYSYQIDDEISFKWDQLSEKHQQFLFPNEYFLEIRHKVRHLIDSLIEITERDSLFILLLIMISLFSSGQLVLIEDQTVFKNSLEIYRSQSHYIQLLQYYLSIKNNKNEYQTIKRWMKISEILLRMQIGTTNFVGILRNQFSSEKQVDQLTPLVQTVLQISS